MNTAYLQQGDELLFKTAKLPKGLKVDKTCDLMRSPVTGHCHKLKGAELFRGKNGERFILAKKKASLVHEEHNTVVIEKGAYEVKTVQEYDHFEEESRNVID